LLKYIAQGKVYVSGYCATGQLGLNRSNDSVITPEVVVALSDEKIVDITFGSSNGYFLTGIS
jgi:uncharacterized protein (AIM24 family)